MPDVPPHTPSPNPYDPRTSPDAAPRRTPWWLWTLLVVLIGAVVVMQRPESPNLDARRTAATGATVPAPDDTLVLVGKLGIAGKPTLGPSAPMLQGVADSLVGWEPANPMGGPISPSNPPKARTTPFPAADRVRVAIIAAEVIGPDAALARLALVETDTTLTPDSPLRADIAALKNIYATPPVPIDDAQRTALRDRHRWFADLALSFPDPAAPVRTKAQRDGTLMLLTMTGGVLLAGAGTLAGCVLLLIAAINYRKMRSRFVAPIPGSQPALGPPHWVWLETVIIFVAGFLALKLITEALGNAFPQAPWLGFASLAGQWLLLATIFWPCVRGVRWQDWKAQSGWHAPRGLFREILAGIAGYLATLPIYFAMAVVVVILTFILGQLQGGEPPVPEGNRVTEIIGGGSPIIIGLVFLLATLWAPIVEESIFRGALYRHLRRRWVIPLAAIASAGAFAVMHGYVIQGLIMVGTLGVAFALIREWRGSLIPCVVAHMIHNGVVLSILIIILSLAQP